jgi:type VI secretion system secreted protein Hcp
MPMPIYLTLEGENQGAIDGSCDIKGHEKQILIEAVDHIVDIPASPQTGLPTGKRVHRPLTVTKAIDKSSPKLYQALCSGEHLKNVQLYWFRISAKGQEEEYYHVKLENAIIVNMRTWMPNCLDQTKAQFTHMEDVSFTYEKIVWTWKPDGIESEDSWLAPKA